MKIQDATFLGGPFFDGEKLHHNRAIRFLDECFAGLVSPQEAQNDANKIDLDGDILSVGYVDLQLNGGGGVMFNHDPSVDSLHKIEKAHRSLGATTILPTLITDVTEKTHAAIDAVLKISKSKQTAIAGLHLEGPHLSIARKGAHSPKYIRSMEEADLALLLEAVKKLDVLKVTIAPENVTLAQVKQMSQAGVIVSLGHTDANFDTCVQYFDAGATCTTHLFNAMSQLGNREPGLVGAALSKGDVWTGLIADGLHVHPQSMRIALMAKQNPERLFLVSDAMAVAGTEDKEFYLEGRRVNRDKGRLTLDNGTLAGADLDLTTSVRLLTSKLGVSLERALRAVTTVPASLIGIDQSNNRHGNPNLRHMIRITKDLMSSKPILND